MSWRKHFSEKAQKDYYFHSITKRSQFDKPPDFLEECFLKVKISYINSPADSKKVAQAWSENTLFSELLSKVMSKGKLPLFNSDKCEVQLWNYDDSKEPMVVSMEDSLSQTFAICDKIPEVEFLLHKLQSNDTPHIAKNDENEQLLTDIKPELLDKDRYIRNLNATLTNEEVEESLTNIEPQLSNKDQYTTNINNLWEEVKWAGEQQPQIYKEKVQIQIKQEENIPSSEDEYLNDKTEEKIEMTANLSPLLMHLPNSESNIKKLKRVRFLDSLDVNEKGNFKSFAEPPRQYSRLGEYTTEIDNSDINDDVENEYSNNSTKWNRDNTINNYYDDNGSIDINIEEEFEEQEDLLDGESCIHDNSSARNKDGNRNSDKYVILKYEDINKSHYSADREEISDQESCACDISSPIDHNNDDDREPLRSNPMIKQDGSRILCCNYLGAQLGLERNGVPFSCHNSARRCLYAHICTKSYPMDMVLERLALVPPALRDLLIPAYMEQKERERRQESADRNRMKQKERNKVIQKEKRWNKEMQKEKLKTMPKRKCRKEKNAERNFKKANRKKETP
mmetsp:Transcript_20783/g.20140  ORF Transcript_20783/g.20140 Transcript_20783/m.20140 type:complete len:566 (-) Transcript_20783:1035-2732(-)